MADAVCSFCSKFQTNTHCHGGDTCPYGGIFTVGMMVENPHFEQHFNSIMSNSGLNCDEFAEFLHNFQTQECTDFLEYAFKVQRVHSSQVDALEARILALEGRIVNLERQAGHDGLWYRRFFLLADRLVRLVDDLRTIVGRVDRRMVAPTSGDGGATGGGVAAIGGTADGERVADLGWGQWARGLIPVFGDVRLIARWLRDCYRWLSDFRQFWASLRDNDRSDR